MNLPPPEECRAVYTAVLGLFVGFVGLAMITVFRIEPWGFYLFTVGGLTWFVSALYCIVWEETYG